MPFIWLFFIVSASTLADSPANIIINGGFIPTEYRERHRNNVAFFYDLFGQKARVLDGGGPDGLYVPQDEEGNHSRDPLGFLKLASSRYDFKTEPATRRRVEAAFNDLAATRPKTVNLVYGDHGAATGVKLWNRDTLTFKDIQANQSKFPASTVIRSIHLHCYSGSAIVDPNREFPTERNQFLDFIKRNYRSNSCAFGLSYHDEVAINVKWSEGSWSDRLKGKTFSLKQLQEYSFPEEKVYSIPVLTSNYLIEDYARYYCDHRSPNFSPSAEDTSSHTQSRMRPVERRSAMCQEGPWREKLDVATDKVYANDKIYDQAKAERNAMAGEYLKEKFPELYEKYHRTMPKVEKLQADYVLGSQSAKAVDSAVKTLRDADIIEYERLLRSLPEVEDFKRYLQTKEKGDLLDRISNLSKETRAAMADRKATAKEYLEKRRELIEGFLKNPENKMEEELGKIYASIKACEASTMP